MKTSTLDLFRVGDTVTALCQSEKMAVAKLRKAGGLMLCRWWEDGRLREQWFFPWQLAAPLRRLDEWEQWTQGRPPGRQGDGGGSG